MVLLLDPDEPEVAEAAGAARELFTRLGARLLLDRLDDAVGRSEPAPVLS